MRHLRAGLLALLTLAGACQSEQPTDPSIPLGDIQLAVVSGNTQVGDPGTELGTPLVARITDAAGKKLKGVLVNFRVVSGGGSVFAGAAVSDDNGLVQDYWTLGTTGSQVVEVRAVNSTTGGKQTFATFTATFTPPPPPPSDVDSDGFTVTQGDCNDNDANVNPGAVDAPDPTFTDHDCDGVDGRASNAVFVSVTGTNSLACGTLAAPCASITFGLAQAATSGKPHVYIAVGSYNEAVQLRNGVSLFGGYASNFASRSLANRASITGSNQDLNLGARYTVVGASLTQPISFVALVVRGANAIGQLPSGAGIHSVGILLLNSSAAVTITQTDIFTGNGSAGLDGSNGSSATAIAAQSGGTGGSALESQTAFCDETSHGAAGSAGGSGLLAGGAGGAGGTKDTDCDDIFRPDFTARAGNSGVAAAITSGLLGTPGGGGAVCAPGVPGHDGRVTHGANGTGGGSPVVVGGFLVISSGSNGSLGLDGGGGGGGGGSGACDTGTDSYGAGGGGGGSGGLRATSGGAGGSAGGASIGIYLSAANATIQGVNIQRGSGGNGGDGGLGGRGQPGGAGGLGGLADGDSQAGGSGGDGGTGGHSGAGGGGSGGMSVGILSVAGSTTSLVGNAISGGAAGLAGSGGARFDGVLAANGTTGTVTATLTIP